MLEERSQRLSARVEALAVALRESGADPEAASRLLETAAAATLKALTLELLLERPQPAPTSRPSVTPVMKTALPKPERALGVPLAA